MGVMRMLAEIQTLKTILMKAYIEMRKNALKTREEAVLVIK